MKTLLIALLLVLNCAAFSQADTMAVAQSIYFKNVQTGKNSYTIGQFDKVKVWINGTEEPIFGNMSYLNDSAVRLNEAPIAITDIDKIRVSPVGGKVVGGVLLGVGAALTAGGTFLFLTADNVQGLSEIFYYIVGFGAVTVGLPMMIGGIFTLVGSPKTFDLDKWDLRFKPS